MHGGQRPISLEYQIYPPAIDTLVTGMLLSAHHKNEVCVREAPPKKNSVYLAVAQIAIRPTSPHCWHSNGHSGPLFWALFYCFGL